MIETKNSPLPIDLKEIGDKGTIKGYISIFGNVDSYGEIVEPGAFTDTLAKSEKSGRKAKLLWQHDTHQPIGVWDALGEDRKGLWGEGRLLIDESPKAREAHGLLLAGALDGLSIGYRTIKAEPKAGKEGIISLTKLDLLEGSIVTFAANDRARVEVVKSMLIGGSMPTIREFQETLRELGFSKSKAEAMASACAPHLRGEPEVEADPMAAFWAAMRSAPIEDLTGEP
jgi:HK97 family phage prohead protease